MILFRAIKPALSSYILGTSSKNYKNHNRSPVERRNDASKPNISCAPESGLCRLDSAQIICEYVVFAYHRNYA